jgi:hypothetical protein
MDFETLIRTKGKCCATDLPISTSESINLVGLNKIATWKFPIVGNVLTGEHGKAAALVHDDAINPDGSLKCEIKYAIEFKGDDILYHPIDQLADS